MFAIPAIAQELPSDESPDGLWTIIEEVDFPRDFRPPAEFTALQLDLALLETILAGAPRETFGPIVPDAVVSIPIPGDRFVSVPAAETRLMEAELANLFPEIRTYVVRDEFGRTGGHLAIGPDRAEFAVRLGNDLMRIEPLETSQGTVYLSFLERDRGGDGEDDDHVHPPIGELPTDPAVPLAQALSESFGDLQVSDLQLMAMQGLSTGQQLRIYRLAATTTGELYQARGGNNLSVVFSLVADLLGANAVFEPELAVRVILAAATFDLLYTNPVSDPFDNAPPRCSGSNAACTTDNDCGGGETCDVRTPCQLRVDNRNNLVALHNGGIVDQGDYDLGVLFAVSHPGARGGCAWYNVCETGNGVNHKGAAAVTARGNPNGTGSTSGVLAHESGHQFGARHTFSGLAGSCTLNEFLAGATGPNGENQSGYEPGSGTTRMSYRGNCSDNSGNDNVDTSADAPADGYFHSGSFDEIVDTVFFGTGSTCGSLVATGNSAPTVDAGPDYTIPRQTPFTLTPAGWSDAQPLTFNWEQFDLPTVVTGADPNDTRRPIDTDLGDGPIIRSVPPGADPTRTVPNLQDLLDGITRRGEILPQVDRSMNFRFIARDNQMGGGGVAYDSMQITVQGEPFFITSPNSGSFEAACEVPLTWQVGGGAVAGSVSALFSSDGGQTFDTVLADSVPNSGQNMITMPCALGGAGRIKLAADDNIFFDINDENLTVFNVPPEVSVNGQGGEVDDACEFTVEFSATVSDACSVDADDVSVDFFKAEENFTLGEPQIQFHQIAPNEVAVEGSVLVSDLLSSPAMLAIEVTAEDACGAATAEHVEVAVTDETPPEIDVALDPTILWPPNHKMVQVTAEVVATDNCPVVNFALSDIISSEPDNGLGDGDTSNDIQDAELGTADTAFRLRAERGGPNDGRIYTVTYTAVDGANNVAEDSAEVTVPASQ